MPGSQTNSFDESDYRMGLKVLHRISDRCTNGIVIFRDAAGREVFPSATTRALLDHVSVSSSSIGLEDVLPHNSDFTGDFITTAGNKLAQDSFCKGKALLSGSVVSPYHVDDDL